MSSPELVPAETPSNQSFRSTWTMEEALETNQLPSTGSRTGADRINIPSLSLPVSGQPLSGAGPSQVFAQYNVYAPQNLEIHMNQVRLEVRELEMRAEVVHRQSLETVEHAARSNLADLEQRAELLHLEKVAELEDKVAQCEMQSARREQALVNEMAVVQRRYAERDDSLRKELEEAQRSKVEYALDAQLQEQRLAQNLQVQATNTILESQAEMVQQFQANFELFKERQAAEHRSVVYGLQEQNEDLQDRLDAAEHALDKVLDQREVLENSTAPPKGQPATPPGFSGQAATPSGPSAPKAPMFSVPNAIPSSARELFASMNPTAATTAHKPNSAPEAATNKPVPGETAHPAAEPGTPNLGDKLLLETQMAILESLRTLKGERKDEEYKPKVKEAEAITLPEFPNPETYRSWKTATREAVRAASDSPDEAFAWVMKAYDKEASHESLSDPGKFLTLDTKLLAALTKIARGELSREVLIFKETEAAKHKAVRGRQVLYLFDQYFKTNEEVGSLYSVEDLLKVRLLNDDLSTFLGNWDSVMSGLSHTPDETTLRDIFLRELRQSKRLKYDLEIFDRAKEGTEQHSYSFLKESIKSLLTRERKRKNRDRVARSHGDKYGAPATPRSTSPSARSGRGRSQSPKGSRPRSPGRSRSSTPQKSRSASPKGVCYDFLKGNCKRGDKCMFLHKKRSLSPKGPKPKKKINATCKFWKEGTCTRGDACRFQHKDIEKPSTPAPKAEAAAAPRPSSPRANSPAPRRGRSPRAKSKGKPEKPAACAFAAAAPRHDPGLEDSWEVDFKAGKLIRHHKTYRKNWYVPDNSCPVNFKRLKGEVKVERVLPIQPFVATKQYDWRKALPGKPDDLWVGKTIFSLRPMPKVSFDDEPVMIGISPDGNQRKHSYLPRVYSNNYPTARDCPRPDSQETKRAVLWAKQFERVIQCMKADMKPSCGYECLEEGWMCEHCEKLSRPACAGLVPGLEFLADTGSEEDLISKHDHSAHFPSTPIGVSDRPVSLITANGPVQGNHTVKLEVPELGSTLECYVLESTPPVCSVGRRCMDEGFDFHWYAGKNPYFVTPEGQKLYCKLRGRVPVIGENSIASPATGNKLANGPVLRAPIDSGFTQPAAY